MLRRLIGGAVIASSLALAGCGAASPHGDVEARLARSERLLAALIERFERAGRLPAAAPDPAVTYAVAIGAHDLVEGPADAKVTLIEAYEFLCPYCKRVDPTIQALRKKYGTDLRVVSKYMVVHGTPAVAPALLACAAHKQGKLAPARDALWATLFDAELNVIEAHTETAHLVQVSAPRPASSPRCWRPMLACSATSSGRRAA